jgi:hypothetical protein
MALRFGKALLVAAAIFAAGLGAVFISNGADRWVGPVVLATIVALIGFGIRYVLVGGKTTL